MQHTWAANKSRILRRAASRKRVFEICNPRSPTVGDSQLFVPDLSIRWSETQENSDFLRIKIKAISWSWNCEELCPSYEWNEAEKGKGWEIVRAMPDQDPFITLCFPISLPSWPDLKREEKNQNRGTRKRRSARPQRSSFLFIHFSCLERRECQEMGRDYSLPDWHTITMTKSVSHWRTRSASKRNIGMQICLNKRQEKRFGKNEIYKNTKVRACCPFNWDYEQHLHGKWYPRPRLVFPLPSLQHILLRLSEGAESHSASDTPPS